jgi:hypothetical protein
MPCAAGAWQRYEKRTTNPLPCVFTGVHDKGCVTVFCMAKAALLCAFYHTHSESLCRAFFSTHEKKQVPRKKTNLRRAFFNVHRKKITEKREKCSGGAVP